MEDARLRAELEVFRKSPEELVEHVYRLALRRAPEPEALAEAAARLRDGTLSAAALLADAVNGDEFRRLRVLDDALAHATWARRRGERPRELEAPAWLDERAIEIPWTLARYRGERRVLDVGYAFAEPAYLAALTQAAPGEVVGVDLAERAVPRVRSVRADVRELPFEDGAFEVALCISTLEHVGLDNTRYGVDGERDDEGRGRALGELGRVLGRGGRLLVTVPTGEREDHGAFVQLEPDAWLSSFAEAGLECVEHETYERTEDGWRSRSGLAPAGLRYGSRGDGAAAVLCAELRPWTALARVRRVLRPR
jgi:SAM-dependent methyltransferase